MLQTLHMTEYSNNATIASCFDVTEELFIIQVEPDSGEVPPFAPGQYAELAVLPEDSGSGKATRRAYSIASSPAERSYLEFFIAHVKEGLISPQLRKLAAGDRLWLGPKIKGKFTLEDAPKERNLALISTGTGIAPFISMIRNFRISPPWKRLALINGVRLGRDLGYREELEKLQLEDSSFRYLPLVSRESGWTGRSGRVQSLFESSETFESAANFALDPSDCSIFLCGNPEMIDSMQQILEGRGFRLHSKMHPGNLHLERYW